MYVLGRGAIEVYDLNIILVNYHQLQEALLNTLVLSCMIVDTIETYVYGCVLLQYLSQEAFFLGVQLRLQVGKTMVIGISSGLYYVYI